MLAIVGLISICLGGYTYNKIKQDYNLTLKQGGLLIVEKIGIESPFLKKLLSPNQKFQNHNFHGNFKLSYPRILFKDKSSIEQIRRRYLSDIKYRKAIDKDLKYISSWVCKKDYKAGSKAIDNLLKMTPSLPENQEDFGSGLNIAVNYDLLSDHPDWTAEKRDRIEEKLHKSLSHSLQYLDGESASLWHGRFQLACSSWLAASVLKPTDSQNMEFQRRSQAHFIEAVEAISLTQGWPEGYNYWINSRAYPFALACLSHMNSVEAPKLNQKIKNALEYAGLWTIYGTEPNGRFTLFGDTGPRNDLKDETQRVIDLIYLGTGNPVFKYYSTYIESLHKKQSYYRGYRWIKPILQGLPELGFYNKRTAPKSASFLKKDLKKSHIFGPGFFDQAFIRSGWSKKDSFISYRAGDTFSHHGHYKAGHFTLFKYEPLVLSSGTYGGYFSPHRLNYYIRTISANSILIIDPDETVAPNQFFKKNVNDGGQRIIIPTGSAIHSIKNWKDNLNKGKRFESGNIDIFDNSNPDYVYIKSDLTPAYGKKAVNVQRELVYLNKEDVLIVHDIVESKEAHFKKKWLLHSNNKPFSSKETLLKGTPKNGILETMDKNLRIQGEKQNLTISILLPENSVVRKVGGPDFKYYVETDGNDKQLNGENMLEGAKESPWFDNGLWRVEISSSDNDSKAEFLVILKPETSKKFRPIDYTLAKAKTHTELNSDKFKLIFYKNSDRSFEFHKTES